MEIKVLYSEEGLFGTWPADERAGVDVDESKLRFVEEVRGVLTLDFPEAEVVIAEGLDSVTVDGLADSEDALWAREAVTEIYNDAHFWATLKHVEPSASPDDEVSEGAA